MAVCKRRLQWLQQLLNLCLLYILGLHNNNDSGIWWLHSWHHDRVSRCALYGIRRDSSLCYVTNDSDQSGAEWLQLQFLRWRQAGRDLNVARKNAEILLSLLYVPVYVQDVVRKSCILLWARLQNDSRGVWILVEVHTLRPKIDS